MSRETVATTSETAAISHDRDVANDPGHYSINERCTYNDVFPLKSTTDPKRNEPFGIGVPVFG